MLRSQLACVTLFGLVLACGCSKSSEPTTTQGKDQPLDGVSAAPERALAQADEQPPREGLIRTDKGWYDPKTHKVTPFKNADATAPKLATDWYTGEAGLLSHHVQLTDPAMFSRAGEAYFDPGAHWIIFQASPREQMQDGVHAPYSMYVAKLIKETGADGLEHITGIESPIRVSAARSHNTCGFFNPAEPWRIIFGSTIIEPAAPKQAGYQRDGSKYAWDFPEEMEVCTRVVQEIYDTYRPEPKLTSDLDFLPGEYVAKPLMKRPGRYDAECAYSPDGRWIVYGSVEPTEAPAYGEQPQEVDLWVVNVETGENIRIVDAPGYDGGPFFSPDGRRICYRSDRKNNDLLQIFVADLAFDKRGAITGVAMEHQLTDNHHVNWAPFWHPSGEFLIYTTSEMGHDNYEVYSINVPSPGAVAGIVPSSQIKRITHASGFDGLPVFSNDGAFMMWTSQRGDVFADDARPSSQLWVARAGALAP